MVDETVAGAGADTADDAEADTVTSAEASESPAAADAPAQAPAKVAAPKAATAAAGSAGEGARQNRRKVREGIAVANGMDKTAVISVVERVRHPRYAKTMQRTKRLYVHDEENSVGVGDRVRVQETRPLSKLKRWRVVEIVERAR